MQGKDIHNLVLVKLDEFTPFGPDSGATLLAGGDNLDEVKPIYRYVSEHLAEAANEMLMGIALHHLRYKSPNVDCVADEDDGCIGSIVMPSDYLRLHTLWLKGWAHPVHETIKAGHPMYIKQFNPWSRGHADKPIVTETGLDASGNTYHNTLHYYSINEGMAHEVREFKYIPKFNEDEEYEQKVAEAIALHCARKVCEVFGSTEQVGVLTNEINSVMENMRL